MDKGCPGNKPNKDMRAVKSEMALGSSELPHLARMEGSFNMEMVYWSDSMKKYMHLSLRKSKVFEWWLDIIRAEL